MDVVLFGDALFSAMSPLRSMPSGLKSGHRTVAENSATIIDFNTYRARKRMVLGKPRDGRHEHSGAVVPLGFYFFWPVLAWMPIGLLLTPSATEDFA
jgi:hypothetical protein